MDMDQDLVIIGDPRLMMVEQKREDEVAVGRQSLLPSLVSSMSARILT